MKIAILEPIGISEEKLKNIELQCEISDHQLVMYSNKIIDDEGLIDRAKDAEVIVVSNLSLNSTVLSACKKLKMISVAFTGVDHIDMKYCKENDIMVSNSSGYANESVAELTFGMIFGVYRNIVKMDVVTRAGLDRKNRLGTELNGKTLGIIGTGAIGQRVAEIGAVFGCKILCYNRTEKDINGVKSVSKEELLKNSDIVTLHIPLTPETKDFINTEELHLMKPSAILINTARGAVVNTDALVKALQDSAIAGAASDVYETEPPISVKSKIFEAPNTLLLPHIAYATKEAIDKRTDIVFQNIWQCQKGIPQNIME